MVQIAEVDVRQVLGDMCQALCLHLFAVCLQVSERNYRIIRIIRRVKERWNTQRKQKEAKKKKHELSLIVTSGE
jgi:hypothetical protein